MSQTAFSFCSGFPPCSLGSLAIQPTANAFRPGVANSIRSRVGIVGQGDVSLAAPARRFIDGDVPDPRVVVGGSGLIHVVVEDPPKPCIVFILYTLLSTRNSEEPEFDKRSRLTNEMIDDYVILRRGGFMMKKTVYF
ncbi:MAG: hypothetical protein ACM3ZC_02995 [Bacteroidota bacterium]